MPITKAAIEEAKAVLQGPLEKVANEQLEKRGGLGALRIAIRDLTGLSKNALESLSVKLPELVKAVLEGPIYRKLVSSEEQLGIVLFGKAGVDAADFLRDIQIYRQQLARLSEFVKSTAFDRLIKNQSQFHNFEKLAAVLFDRQSGLIDRYASLRVESDAYNQLVKRLFPGDFPDLRIDDHHIIEARAYAKFQKTWQLIGWKSSDDMAAIPLMTEFHIRSPKTLLPDIKGGLALKDDFTSLTNILQASVDLNKIKTTDQLLNAYEDVYRKTKIWDSVKPVLKAVRLEISKQETLAKGFKSLK
jgi:hypothetical protein